MVLTSRSTELAIEAHGLVKLFGNNRAVDGVDLAVRTGTVYGVLGPNGAGKTTTISMLATLMKADAGEGSTPNSRRSLRRSWSYTSRALLPWPLAGRAGARFRA